MADQTNAEVSDEQLREPVFWISSKQMPTPVQGGYVAARAAPEGNFDTPLYTDLNRRSVTSQASEGEVVGYQRRLRNTREDVVHKYGTAYPKGVWSRWSECTEAQFQYALAHGRVEDFPDYLEAEVRPVYASPSKRVERLETALTLLLAKTDDVLGQLGPGGYLLPSGAGLTNALSSAANEARQALQGGRS